MLSPLLPLLPTFPVFRWDMSQCTGDLDMSEPSKQRGRSPRPCLLVSSWGPRQGMWEGVPEGVGRGKDVLVAFI